jgi:putative Ca2+/H+ antiporter (TMEM165/GDT1 family)
MDLKLAITVFVTVFVAELGDKTQLSTLLFASSPGASKWSVFLGAALALLASAALGVLAGAAIGARLDPRWLARIAGGAFIAIGIWTLLKG